MIDFKRLNKDGDDFELLCRDILEDLGSEIISRPAKGPDQKKDILIKISNKDILGRTETITYLVQCKHKAHGGKSVLESDLGDFRSACDFHGAKGYLLITSTFPSVTVNNNFEAVNEKGEYKTQIWDYKILESKIDECPNSSKIIKRYNLKDNIDILYQYTKKIIESFDNLPFSHINSVEKDDYKIHIYEQVNEIETSELEIKTIKLNFGFICSDNLIKKEISDSLIREFKIVKLTHVSEDIGYQPNYIETMNLDQLSKSLGQFKDTWYQSRTIQLIKMFPQNPFGIRVLEQFYKSNPYKVQYEMIEFIKESMKKELNEENHPMFISEILDIIKKFRLDFLVPDIYKLLINIHNSKLAELYKSYLIKKIMSLFGEFDVENRLLSKIEELYKQSKWIQFKADCLEYYKLRKSDYFKKEANKLNKKYGDKEILPGNHATFYNSENIRLMKNSIPWTVSKSVEEYLKEL